MTGTREQHEVIKMRLRLAGSSLACIARELGIPITAVRKDSAGSWLFFERSRLENEELAHA